MDNIDKYGIVSHHSHERMLIESWYLLTTNIIIVTEVCGFYVHTLRFLSVIMLAILYLGTAATVATNVPLVRLGFKIITIEVVSKTAGAQTRLTMSFRVKRLFRWYNIMQFNFRMLDLLRFQGTEPVVKAMHSNSSVPYLSFNSTI